ncbi:hypothetical protein [Saccharospirillum salsuginis]|uniref:T4 bacteriophage base plate protein n=1 Tax=Saccharospirillum salsuginis TaxID=418750 RepID=A0A918JZ02_9GAMM|nr:hypothetical protein [Saccharospirillum salsuginis]GGX39093.1 hypothetical protein GCM10007392_01750 [Saccharospirillum salsuginis]
MTVLPGGLIRAQQRRRDFKLARPRGELDLRLHDGLAAAVNHPRWISDALSTVLDELAGEKPTPGTVAELCVADRQFLAVQWRLACRSDPDQPTWFSADCHACDAPYDFALNWQDLPIKPAGEGFPVAELELSCGTTHIKVPDGAVQSALAEQPEQDEPDLWMARRLIQSVNGETIVDPKTLRLSDEDIGLIEDRVETLSPELGLVMQTQCPECGAEQKVELDPYANLARPVDSLLQDIHRLARCYHWSEAAILDLPVQRRRHYLRLIDQDRGLNRQEAE